MNVHARVSNGLVREVIYFDPQGDFTPNLVWVQVSNSITTGANISGDTYAIQQRWSYDGMMFNPPRATSPLPKPSGRSTQVNHFALTGKGPDVWTEIGNVSILASLNTAHFLSYSTDVYDANLLPYSTQIIITGSNTEVGNREYGNQGNQGSLVESIQLSVDFNIDTTDISAGQPAGQQADPGNPGPGGCFTADTQVLMSDGSNKCIKDIQIGEELMGDNGTVNVLNKWVGIGNYVLVDFNKKGYFITSNHPVLTDQGWGAVDVMLFAATEPKSYERVLQANGYRPLVSVIPGIKLAIWLNESVQYENLDTIDLLTPKEILVYNLNVSGHDHYIANGYIVHNKDLG